MWHVPPDFWKDVFLAILQFPFSPWKNTQKHRFELSILNFWAPRNLIRNIVPLILKSLGSQRSNHQHQHLKVRVFFLPNIWPFDQYFPIFSRIFHFWDDLGIRWILENQYPTMQPCLVRCCNRWPCRVVTCGWVPHMSSERVMTVTLASYEMRRFFYTLIPLAKFCLYRLFFGLFVYLFVLFGWFVLDLSIFCRTNC